MPAVFISNSNMENKSMSNLAKHLARWENWYLGLNRENINITRKLWVIEKSLLDPKKSEATFHFCSTRGRSLLCVRGRVPTRRGPSISPSLRWFTQLRFPRTGRRRRTCVGSSVFKSLPTLLPSFFFLAFISKPPKHLANLLQIQMFWFHFHC